MQSNLVENERYKDTRIILYHKSTSSARTVFFRQASGSVCLFDELPRLSQIMDDIIKPDETNNIITLPTSMLKGIAKWLELKNDELEIDSEFYEQVDIAEGPLSIYLVRIKMIDPPFSAAEKVGAKFSLITELRDLIPAELDLLRSAYSAIMGG